MKTNQKHLTLSDRIIIEKGLNEGKTFVSIADMVHKDPTTVSKEIRRHRSIKQRKDTSTKVKCNQYKELFPIILTDNCTEF